jgi:predicted RNA-binding Zn ribbon-like protein
MGDWVWDGGRLSLDLLNTVRDRAQVPRETLHTPADLGAWLTEAGLFGGPVDERTLEAARGLRAAVDALAFPTGPPTAEAIATVNAAATNSPGGVELTWTGDRFTAEPPEPSAESALARIALDAIDLLTGDERLRICAADDCGVRFADRSPAGNRQWCSMTRCGNRAKARRHYARGRD